MSLSDSTKAYLQARYQKFNEKEKIVSVLMDEVYCQRSVQYANGQFYGVENETYTKTLLCVMLKSIAGKYRDIIAMMPIASISADILYQVWNNVVSFVSTIGFDIAVTMTDDHSANVCLFHKKILKNPGDHFHDSALFAKTIRD